MAELSKEAREIQSQYVNALREVAMNLAGAKKLDEVMTALDIDHLSIGNALAESFGAENPDSKAITMMTALFSTAALRVLDDVEATKQIIEMAHKLAEEDLNSDEAIEELIRAGVFTRDEFVGLTGVGVGEEE